MGILETLLKPAEKKPLGICIPDHAKPKEEKTGSIVAGKAAAKKALDEDVAVSSPADFEVDGIYEVKQTFMLTGTVAYGTLSKNSVLVYDGLEVPVQELMLHGKSVPSLVEGEKGAVTISPDCYLRIVSGQTLAFK